jgi:glutamate dehydrogenase
MKPSYQKQQAALLKHLLAALPKSAPAEARRFAEHFFSKLLVSDLEKLEAARAGAIALSMYDFFRKRDVAAPTIRIFMPTTAEHGYHSKSLVIEIINDDMPFLIDSLMSALTRQGFRIHETYHPIFSVTRDGKGELTSLGEKKDMHSESFIHFEVSPLPENLTAEQLAKDLQWVLTHIRAAVRDWKPILGKLDATVARLKKAPKAIDSAHLNEVRDFISWLSDRNFVFLGFGEYDFVENPDKTIAIHGHDKLGILTIAGENSHKGLEALPQEQRQHLLIKQQIEITKSNRRSLVHRRVPMDYIAIKKFDEAGNVTGEIRFLGLFTSNVYYQSTSMIPLLRDKIARVVERSGFAEASHDRKAFATILEFLPRDEVLQMSEDDLFEVGMGVLALEAKPGVGVFIRADAFERFVSAMIFVPREQFSTELRREIQHSIEQAYNGITTAFTTQITDAPLARLHLTIRTKPGEVPAVEVPRLEKSIARLAYAWSDQLLDALSSKYEEHKALALHKRYANAFPPSYIARHDAFACCNDIEEAEIALAKGGLAVKLYQLPNEESFVHLKIYNPMDEIALSDILPILENAGFRVIEEQPYPLTPKDIAGRIWIRDFKLELPTTVTNIAPRKDAVEKALLAAWQGNVENDRLNALVLLSDITHREVVVLRTISKYLKQTGFGVTQTTIGQALVKQPFIAKQLIELFHARFAPDAQQRDVKTMGLKNAIEKALDNVSSAIEDRILRVFTQTIGAMLRTNYYQNDRPVLSIKFDSAAVPSMPLPVPFAEIFVYSPRVEGIHLRGGKVARGGLRWSDRPDDFRTEVLGLMKAQMVKNAVIVPVGSKGGFVLKKAPDATDRDAMQKEGIACYKLYLQGLLDITDNLVANKIMPPANVVRHDGDDPYLVVAADKGTASFSDIANGVSQEYNFWLGDAFASGGSAGYDHKEMAITARGGWISVERHFAEMGRHIANEDFTCVGIGDMAGDVFGNGMLLSKHIRLIAAFNHQHIFIDPQPDAAVSFSERERLFKLPRSSWKDYNTKLISVGGGVYERSAKSVDISPQAMVALGITKNKLSPDDLIRAILLAPVDLLWNGGIGTYVKAEDESHDQVGDRANNALRVNGRELRCKIVGEGGNLGFTQKGRIEYAHTGGRINTDAIDNSAGVDCSDHEVNIKIAFSHLLSENRLSPEKRDHLLETMTDDVAALVLKDNMLQTLAISVAQQAGGAKLDAQINLMHALEKKGLLTRTIEYLPTDQQLAELKAKHAGLTRPELAVLLAYSKMDLYKSIVQSDALDDSYFENELVRYFPKAMQNDYRDAILGHPLKREIIGTMLTNSVINRMGCTFVNDLVEAYRVEASDVAVAYAIVRDAFNLREHWKALDMLTGKLPVAQQVQLFNRLQQFIKDLVVWLLVNTALPLSINDVNTRIIVPAQKRMEQLPQNDIAKVRAETLVAQGAPTALARFISNMDIYATMFDIVHLAAESHISEDAVATIYNKIAAKFSDGNA